MIRNIWIGTLGKQGTYAATQGSSVGIINASLFSTFKSVILYFVQCCQPIPDRSWLIN